MGGSASQSWQSTKSGFCISVLAIYKVRVLHLSPGNLLSPGSTSQSWQSTKSGFYISVLAIYKVRVLHLSPGNLLGPLYQLKVVIQEITSRLHKASSTRSKSR